MKRRLVMAAAAAALVPRSGSAQSPASGAFPDRPVRFVVPYPPGGSTDPTARLVGAGLTAIWGHQVVVENRAGGDTIIGSTVVASAPPDGHTILYAATTHVIIPLLHKNMPFNAMKDFVSVATIALFALGVANIAVRATWQEAEDAVYWADRPDGVVEVIALRARATGSAPVRIDDLPHAEVKLEQRHGTGLVIGSCGDRAYIASTARLTKTRIKSPPLSRWENQRKGPGIAARAARASLGLNGLSNSTLMDSEWQRKTGTRTVVEVTRKFGASRIFLVSRTIFTSSEHSPDSAKDPICGNRLKAI